MKQLIGQGIVFSVTVFPLALYLSLGLGPLGAVGAYAFFALIWLGMELATK